MVFMAIDHALALELGNFRRKSAAVYLQIIRQFLAIKRNIKLVAAALLFHMRKVRKNFFSGRTFSRNFQLGIDHNILTRHIAHQIIDHASVKLAAVGAGVQHVRAIADNVRALGSRMGIDEIRIGLCGGLTAESDVILPLLQDALAGDERKYILSVAKAQPIEGALYLAGLR